MSAEQKLVREIEEQAAALARAMATVEKAYEDVTGATRDELSRSLADLRDGNQRRVAGIREEHARDLDRQLRTLHEVEKRSDRWTAPWDSPLFSSFRPAAGVPTAVRFGELKFRGPYNEVATPALLPFIGGRNLVIKCAGDSKEVAANAIESLVLRLLLTIPPGKLRLLLIDPVDLGRHLASFLTLRDDDEELVAGKVWVDRVQIERRLGDMLEHMQTVTQGYLQGKRFKSMEEYNEEAGAVAEAYRLVVAVNFPKNFSEQASRRLADIMRNGPSCGVFTLATVDTAEAQRHRYVPSELEDNSVLVESDNGRFIWRDPLFQQGDLELDTPPEPETLQRLLGELGKHAKSASRVEVPFDRVVPAADDWWSSTTARGITVPIGRHGASKIQTLELVDASPHALMVGQTGSGKTTLMHVIITALALHFSTDEIELYLVDFKGGVGFKHYTPNEEGHVVLPHARVIAIHSEREFGLSCLQALEREMDRRSDLFRDARCENLASYREDTGERLPRILLMVDEFHRFFEEDDMLAGEARRLLGHIARQGRGYGVHVILSTQTLVGPQTLPPEIRGQMVVRIALRCNEADSTLILADDNPAARLLSRPGDAIYNSDNGLVEENTRFQVAWLDDDERAELLGRLRQRFGDRGDDTHGAIIFEGDVPARIGENDLLCRELAAPPPKSRAPRVAAWLGRPVAIKDPAAALFASRAGRNLLVVGRDEELGVSICLGAMVSLAAQISPDDLEFHLLPMTSVDSPWLEVSERLSAALPHRCSIIKRREVPARMDRLASLVDRRVESDDGSGPRVVFVGLGLQRARQFREPEPSYSYDEDRETGPTPHDLLAKVLRDGPEVGVHTIGWWDGLAGINRTVGRRNREEFGVRVALPLATDESNQILDSPAAAKLGRLRALLWDEDRPSQLEKFIPYSLVEEDWLESMGEALLRKWGSK